MKNIKSILAITCLMSIGLPAAASSYTWTDWTSTGTDVVNGAVNFGSTTVNVTFSGNYAAAQINHTGTNYFNCSVCDATYDSVINGPATSDLIELNYSANRTITFSKPVLNPVMAFVSVGQQRSTVDYQFSSPFTLLSQGGGWWGPGSLTQTAAATLHGEEGNGVIRFDGMYSSISWTNPQPEYWHGITVGALAPVPEPETYAMLLAGLGLMGFIARRRTQY